MVAGMIRVLMIIAARVSGRVAGAGVNGVSETPERR